MSDLLPQQMPLRVCNTREDENLCDICDNNGFTIARDQRIDSANRIVEKLNSMDPTRLDYLITQLRELADSKGAALYSIHFRNVGVAFQWWESSRAGEPPGIQTELAEWNKLSSEYSKRGLVIYKYYDTLSEAIEGEFKRLGEINHEQKN